jgi:hypothetical protein
VATDVRTGAAALEAVAAGKLQPARLVDTVTSVAEAGRLLDAMTDYNTLGFAVINDWTTRGQIGGVTDKGAPNGEGRG